MYYICLDTYVDVYIYVMKYFNGQQFLQTSPILIKCSFVQIFPTLQISVPNKHLPLYIHNPPYILHPTNIAPYNNPHTTNIIHPINVVFQQKNPTLLHAINVVSQQTPSSPTPLYKNRLSTKVSPSPYSTLFVERSRTRGCL